MIYVSAAELASCWVGETEKIIKALFRLGRMLFPSIIFVDEAEAFLKSRAGRGQRWEISQVNQFLREANGLVLRKDSPFLLLATNKPHAARQGGSTSCARDAIHRASITPVTPRNLPHHPKGRRSGSISRPLSSRVPKSSIFWLGYQSSLFQCCLNLSNGPGQLLTN